MKTFAELTVPELIAATIAWIFFVALGACIVCAFLIKIFGFTDVH